MEEDKRVELENCELKSKEEEDNTSISHNVGKGQVNDDDQYAMRMSAVITDLQWSKNTFKKHLNNIQLV